MLRTVCGYGVLALLYRFLLPRRGSFIGTTRALTMTNRTIADAKT